MYINGVDCSPLSAIHFDFLRFRREETATSYLQHQLFHQKSPPTNSEIILSNTLAVARIFLTNSLHDIIKFLSLIVRSNETSNTQHFLNLPGNGDSSPVFGQKTNNQEKHGETSIKSFCSSSPSQNSSSVVFFL